MFYKWPEITNLDQVRQAIAGRDEFIVAERDWGYVANYLVNLIDTFPTPNTKDPILNEQYKIRRECRGIKFDLNGNLMARTLHKFFNLGEKLEVDQSRIDWSQPYIILDKLDGSMIHPVLIDRQIVYMTKMGITDVAQPVQLFADQKGRQAIFYNDFCHDLIKSGMTPTFEWCSRIQRIIIDYPEDQLILTAIRMMRTGQYKTYNQMVALATPYRVPVVKYWNNTWGDISDFVKHVQSRENEEGCVTRFNDGHMCKHKNPWYLQLHKTKELLAFEKDVWMLILTEKQDDAKAFMEQPDKDRIDAFARDLYKALDETTDRLKWIVIEAQDNLNGSKKRFAIEYVNNPKKGFINNEKGLLFKIWDGNDPREVVYDYVRNHLSSGPKLEEVRHLAGGILWGAY